MPFIIQYLIKLSVSLSLVYLFYRFVLRPLTFYNWNRWFLLCYSAISFVIPFVDITPWLSRAELQNARVINYIPLIDPSRLSDKPWFSLENGWNWILLFFAVGVIVMFGRLALQLFSYLRLRRKSTLIADAPVKLYQVDLDIVPFSFGNSIFINQQQHEESELQEIISHEFIHVKQKHTADMIWAEVLCILNWYNPFAWLIKKVICQNLEFIADQQVLNNGLDKKQYQYLLLKVAGGASFRIANQFNFSFLKKRIAMMNKMKSARLHLLKFGFVLPLVAVLLLSFRERIESLIINDDNKIIEPIMIIGDTVPASKGEGVRVKLRSESDKGSDSLFLGNDAYSISTEKMKGDTDRITFKSKNGKYPLVLVDDKIVPKSTLDNMDPSQIVRMEVYKDASAKEYGDAGKDGVLKIYTKKGDGQIQKLGKNSTSFNAVGKMDKDSNMVMIFSADSVEISKENKHLELKEPGKEAVRKENLKGEVTKIEITGTKDKSATVVHDTLRIDASNRPKGEGLNIRIRGVGALQNEPLYVIDGVRIPKGGPAIAGLNPDEIESISILKDAQSKVLYGAEAEGGVIIITTKKDSKGQKGEKGDKGEKGNKEPIMLKLKPTN
ncbi:MAG: TonB-dependent receptor plug domain-containing protein [Flavitalea sp.]